MALESFNAYHSYLKTIEPLNDAERGRLFTACLQYSMTGEAPELKGNERFVFPSMAAQIDRDKGKYAARCKKNAENISKRWDTNVYDGKNRIPTDTKHTKDKDKDKDKDNTPCSPPRGAGELFDLFWAEYPKNRRTGKARCAAWFKTHQPDEQTVQAMVAAIRYLKTTEQWTRDGGQFIPMPATFLNQRRWEDDTAKPPVEKKERWLT